MSFRVRRPGLKSQLSSTTGEMQHNHSCPHLHRGNSAHRPTGSSPHSKCVEFAKLSSHWKLRLKLADKRRNKECRTCTKSKRVNFLHHDEKSGSVHIFVHVYVIYIYIHIHIQYIQYTIHIHVIPKGLCVS